MKIVTCFKNVPDERDLKVDASGNIDASGLNLSIGSYDLNAIEAGTQLADNDDSVQYIALTAGDDRSASPKAKKDVLARGPQELVVIDAAAEELSDPVITAQLLSAAIQEIGDVDLILFGDGSGDLYHQQVGLLVGAMLGIPTFNSVASISPAEDGLQIVRNLENYEETIRVTPPCAVCVTSDINVPRINSMKQILAAGKKPSKTVMVNELGVVLQNPAQVVGTHSVKTTDRRKVIFDSDSDENFEKFTEELLTAIHGGRRG